MLSVLEEEFAIYSIFWLTNHAYTATQLLQDSTSKKDFRDGRAGAINLIPSKAGACAFCSKRQDQSVSASCTCPSRIYGYVVVQLEESQTTSIEEINFAFETSSNTYLKGILEYSEADLVSSDIIGNPRSVIFDS